ncbi:MAG: Electron transport complex protein RnfD [bacterium ADurb.Bin157]|nr:MAG: Electron transport complex protein RnfD [bacterium ADurb.Bin157]
MITDNHAAVAKRLMVTSSPHIHSGLTTARVMWEVNIALIPLLAMAIYNFRFYALTVIFASIAGACIAEFAIQKFFFKIKPALADGSALLTGILLALCLPPTIPAWIAFTGGFVAIAFGKQAYGGLGQNIFNPAHIGRAILLASWPVYMTSWIKPGIDAVSTATPLAFLKDSLKDAGLLASLSESGKTAVEHTMLTLNISFSDMFLGMGLAGSIGETSKIAVLIGALFLFIRGHIRLYAPISMILTVFLGAYFIGNDLNFAIFHLLAGGLMIGAFFMVTDMVTSPMSRRGNVLFGIGCGIITLLIRLKGGYPEGVCYSILIMNAFVPLIDKMFAPPKFGTGGNK